MKLKRFKNIFLEAVFPQFCLICHKQGALVCPDCLSLIEILEHTFCPFCSTPKKASGGVCFKHQNRCLNGLFSATEYNQPIVKKLIRSLKYSPHLKTLGPCLAYLIITHISLTRNGIFKQAGENSIFIPMPLHKAKEKQRGFNQAEIISKELSRYLKIPLLINALQKTKKTKSQTNLTKEQRIINIKNSFEIKNPQLIEGKIVFLVDDVFTTGSTMFEAAQTLKTACPAQVWGITAAREPLI